MMATRGESSEASSLNMRKLKIRTLAEKFKLKNAMWRKSTAFFADLFLTGLTIECVEPRKNENMGPLAQNLLRISRWQQQGIKQNVGPV